MKNGNNFLFINVRDMKILSLDAFDYDKFNKLYFIFL